jgi:hypothetical protein
MTADRPMSPLEQVRRAYEETERRTSESMEGLVATEGFSDLLAMTVGNAMSLSKMSGTLLDDVVRRTRLAGRTDVTRLAQQLARTEDKLELLLQHVEGIHDALTQLRADLARPGAPAASAATPDQDT